MASLCFGNFLRYFSRRRFPPVLPRKYKIQLPSTPAANVISMTVKKWILPLAAHTPESGMITPAGKPGIFMYSSNTITKMAMAP